MSNSKELQVAVVILNWNGVNHLQTYLPSVVAHTPPHVHLWVADNGSTDDSVNWLKINHSDDLNILELDENYGFAEGYNRALSEIDADVYVLLNSDVRIDGDWIDPVLKVMHNLNWDVASPAIVRDDNPEICEHAGAAGGLMDRDGFPFCYGRIFDELETLDDWLKCDREVFWASGACFFIRREAWQHAGGFDGSLFAHMEEIDLCWRLKNSGRRVGCAGSVQVRHLGGGTLQTSSPFKTFLNYRNNLLIQLKNRPGFWPGFLFRRMCLDGLAAWRSLAAGEWRQFLAIGRAHAAFYARLGKTLRQRKELKNSRTGQRNEAGWWSRSVTWAYFVNGHRRVRDLRPPLL